MHSRFVSKPTPVYIAAVDALNNLKSSEGISQTGSAYSDAIHEDRLKQYMKQYGLKQSRVNHKCLCYLLGNKKCLQYNTYPRQGSCITLDGVSDHTYMFIRKGKPFVYVTQPYGLTEKGIQSLGRVSEQYGLDVTISTRSWHFPSSTLLIEIHRQGWRQELEKENEGYDE